MKKKVSFSVFQFYKYNYIGAGRILFWNHNKRVYGLKKKS